jgi:amino acid permease
MVMRDVIVRYGDTILFIAPNSFSNPLPELTLLAVEVENNQFDLVQVITTFSFIIFFIYLFENIFVYFFLLRETHGYIVQAPVQLSTTSTVYFFNVTRGTHK